MQYRDKIQRLCFCSMLLGISMLLSYLEAILPLSVLLPLPGFKLGLCNIIITLCFVAISPVDAAIVSLCRIFLMALLFGNITSFTFSLCGGILSYLGLFLFARLLKKHFSMIGISVGCAVLHNIGQLIAAAFWFGTDIVFGYLPFLLIASLIFGGITGVLLELIIGRFSKIKQREISP